MNSSKVFSALTLAALTACGGGGTGYSAAPPPGGGQTPTPSPKPTRSPVPTPSPSPTATRTSRPTPSPTPTPTPVACPSPTSQVIVCPSSVTFPKNGGPVFIPVQVIGGSGVYSVPSDSCTPRGIAEWQQEGSSNVYDIYYGANTGSCEIHFADAGNPNDFAVLQVTNNHNPH